MRQAQICKYWIFFTMIVVLGGCSSYRLAPRQNPVVLEASFFSMGARWQLSTAGKVDAEQFQKLKTKLTGLALLYDKTFSDWSEQSELRMLEKKGLSEKQIPSSLFWKGLELSQKAHELSDGVFDITVGDKIWKVRNEVLGQRHLQMNFEKKSFYFSAPVERLSFGGIIKGMALGDMAEYLMRSGSFDFRIDAGGGNIVEFKKANGVHFVSRSRLFKAGSNSEKHIFDSKNLGIEVALNDKIQIEIMCDTTDYSIESLRRIGALSDAFSTAKLLDSSIELPGECRVSSGH